MNEMHFIVVTSLPAAQADLLTSLSDSAVLVEPSSHGGPCDPKPKACTQPRVRGIARVLRTASMPVIELATLRCSGFAGADEWIAANWMSSPLRGGLALLGG